MNFDYRILKSSKSKHKAVDNLVAFQYYIDCIIQAIKINDLKTLNDKRLFAIWQMLEEYDFLLIKDF